MPNWCFLSVLLSILLPPLLLAQENNIERLEIQGNAIVDSQTYLFHLTQKVGDPYDRQHALDDFHRLWGTGFLDDLTLEVTDGERGKVVTYVVAERPRVQALDFVGSKEIDASDIMEKLEEEGVEIPIESFYDPAKIVKAENIIREMLVDKGRTDGSVHKRLWRWMSAFRVGHLILRSSPNGRFRLTVSVSVRTENPAMLPFGVASSDHLGNSACKEPNRWIFPPASSFTRQCSACL